MTYTPTTWVNNNPPAIDAANLNKMETGINRAQGDVMILYGATADIPATDPNLVGRLYYESDLLKRCWRDNGAGWDLVATSGAAYPALLLATGQKTAYSCFDDGDQELGVGKGYTVTATAGNSLIQVAHYAAATITFEDSDKSITDSASGLVTFLNADTIVIKGSVSNDGTYTIASGGATAGHFHVTEVLVDEVAGRYVSFYKQTSHSNAVVQDTKTGRMWSRTNSTGERVGVLSNGDLNWYDVATRFAKYNVASTVSCIMPGNIFRIIGGAGSTQFHVGDCIMVAGFANAVNLLPNYYITAAADNGANFDITVNPGNEVLIAEGAVGDTIYLNCRGIYNYRAGACLANLSLYADWRIPNKTEAMSLMDDQAPDSSPNAVAFPGWGTPGMWTSTSEPNNPATQAMYAYYADASTRNASKTVATCNIALVRS